MKSQTFTSYDGTKLSGAIIRKPGVKPWLLMFPSFGVTHRWKHMQLLVKDLPYNIIVIDFRAHHNEADFVYDEVKKDVAFFANKFYQEHKDLTVFAHCFGGVALLEAAKDIPKEVKFLAFAPVQNLRRRVPKFFYKLINGVRSKPLISRAFLRFGIFLCNLKTGNIKRSGLRKAFSSWGTCQISKHNLHSFWDLTTSFYRDFPRIKQKGKIIYGELDYLMKPRDEYLHQIRKTGLEIIEIPGFGHYFNSKKRRALLVEAMLR